MKNKKTNPHNITKGQTKFVVYRFAGIRKEYEGKIVSVGRKYFLVQIDAGGILRNIQFWIDDLQEKTDYTPNYTLYPSKERYLELKEIQEIRNALSMIVAERDYTYKITNDLSKLRQGYEILVEKRPIKS